MNCYGFWESLMRFRIFISLMILIGLTACISRQPFPTGEFRCFGTHNGFYASAGDLSLYPDGTMRFSGDSGKWSYNTDTQELTFDENKYLDSGRYFPEQGTVFLVLKRDVTISHAETGEVNCVPISPTPLPSPTPSAMLTVMAYVSFSASNKVLQSSDSR